LAKFKESQNDDSVIITTNHFFSTCISH